VQDNVSIVCSLTGYQVPVKGVWTMCRKTLFALTIAITCGAASLAAQTQTKTYAVTTDRAVNVTREVLQSTGFSVVEVQEQRDGDRVVLYRASGGGGRLERMVIRRVENRIVFVDAPEAFLFSIDEKLAFR
jgi:hypothetical protein